MRIYVKFHDEAEKHPELKMDDEARLWFVKMQEGDEEALTLWKWFLRRWQRNIACLDMG